jgi:acyl-CoA dehydrogenase
MPLTQNELDAVLAAVRAFVREVVVPAEEEIEDQNEVPDSIRKQAADMGLFGFALPVEYGGRGLTAVEEAQLAFEIGWTTPAFRSMFGTNNAIAGQVIAQSGTQEQQSAYLPRMASGEVVASFALTEAEAGSDAGGLRTTALPNDDGYVIDGAKQFITNAPVAGLLIVFARTPTEAGGTVVSAFLVDADLPGVSVGLPDKKMGQRGAISAPVTLEGVVVTRDALLGGTEGRGLQQAMKSLNRGRLHVSALCVGLADRLLSESVTYAESRRQFGSAIADFQLVQSMLARSAVSRHAARALVLEACRVFDEDGRAAIEMASSAKLFATEIVGEVADRAVQIQGGNGYMRGNPVERFYRDARLYRIYEGTSEIQQLVIAKELRRRLTRSKS